MKLNSDKIERTLSFSLSTISDWQLANKGTSVELPPLQRGFVWKANQIESLWDSILRGFPVGSFLLSKDEHERLFLLDGQQRATSIALGYYDPWKKRESTEDNFWSLKNVPVVWIDLAPKEKTTTQKFVIRVITQSHPWGYQRVKNNAILSITDRRNALTIFREDLKCQGSYIKFPLTSAFPYDSNLPVPLSFLIKSIIEGGENWKSYLTELCKKHLPPHLRTKHFESNNKSYLEQLVGVLDNSNVYNTIRNLNQLEIPGIVIEKEILKLEDEQPGEDPTLFVRLNSAGTRIAGEELIYSIYKASFPDAKKLVENISASYIAPSQVISLVSRLVLSEINGGSYVPTINVNEFRKKITDKDFIEKLSQYIGEESNSPAKLLFMRAMDILISKNHFSIPPVLIKNILKNDPDLLLLLLQYCKFHSEDITIEDQTKIIASITALSWFGRDNTKFVREVWNLVDQKNFWCRDVLSIPFYNKSSLIMYPLLQPSLLREYLLLEVVENNLHWDKLYPPMQGQIVTIYRSTLNHLAEEEEVISLVRGIWANFLNKLFACKPLVLFSQREFINEHFEEFIQMETLEDTNAPWDWDHIFPSEWVYNLRHIDHQTRHWNNCIGNLRAEFLEKNRRDGNRVPPTDRLRDSLTESFIKENDWKYWEQLSGRINSNDKSMVKSHLSAIIHRLCNIYEEWYVKLKVAELFDFDMK